MDRHPDASLIEILRSNNKKCRIAAQGYFCAVVAVFCIGLSCKKEAPSELPKTNLGKRDYVWSIDSVYYGGLPGPIELQNIWGSSARDVWGVNGDAPDVRDCLWHYDGAKWSRATKGTPITEFTGNKVVYDVWGSSQNDVWTVGRKISQGVLSAFIMHYDGLSWRDATPANVSLLSNVMYSIYGIAANDFWIYGYEYAIHHDSAEWQPYKVADSLTIASMTRNGNGLLAWAGSAWGLEAEILYRFDGSGFQRIDSTMTYNRKFGYLLHAQDRRILSFANGLMTNTLAADGSLNTTGWLREFFTATYFKFLFVQTERNIFVTGQWNLFYHFNGADWAPISVVVQNHTVDPHAVLSRVWGDGNEVWICDFGNGIVYHGR